MDFKIGSAEKYSYSQDPLSELMKASLYEATVTVFQKKCIFSQSHLQFSYLQNLIATPKENSPVKHGSWFKV